MTSQSPVKPPRERILDAAFEVMHSLGLANATTRQIALQAGYSEAMLYKHFADKQELFLAVLQERLPAVGLDAASAMSGDLIDNLTNLVEGLMNFFVQAFPIAASVFSSPELLRQHREGVVASDRGPDAPVRAVEAYLAAEQAAGRIPQHADCAVAAKMLVGTAFHQGFLAAFDGREAIEDSRATARAVAEATERILAVRGGARR